MAYTGESPWGEEEAARPGRGVPLCRVSVPDALGAGALPDKWVTNRVIEPVLTSQRGLLCSAQD